MSQITPSIEELLAQQVATWPQREINGLFRVPQGVEKFPLGTSTLRDTAQVRLWLEDNARFLLGLEWRGTWNVADRFLRFYAVETGATGRLYLSDSNSYFPNGKDSVRLLTEFRLSDPDNLFLRRLFRTNGVAFGLALLPAVPSDVQSTLEDFGELLRLFEQGFSSADLWETLKEKHPKVWNETYENPVKPSNRLAHRLHAERLRATVEATETVDFEKGLHPDEESSQEARQRAVEALGERNWANPKEKKRIIARYLLEVLDY